MLQALALVASSLRLRCDGTGGLALWAAVFAIAFLAAKFLVDMVYNVYFHPLRVFPGPWLAKASVFPFALRLLNGHMDRWTSKLHLRYGDVVRIMPDELSFINPAAWADIYVSRPQLPKSEKRTMVNVMGARPLPTILRHEDHAPQRRLWNPAFSERALREQEPVLREYADKLMKWFAEHAESHAEIDLSTWLQFATFDIMSDMCFGESFGSIDNSQHHPGVHVLFKGLKNSRYIMGLSLFPSLINFGSACIPSFVRRWFQKALSQHLNFIVERVGRRMQTSPDHADFMKYILENNDDGRLTGDEIISMMQVLIFAGSDTTAMAMTATAWFLLKDRQTMRALQQEVRGSFATSGDITISSCADLPYLRAVLMEAMRLQPPAPVASPRITERAMMIAGHPVPPGTSVGIPQRTANRHPSHFVNANSFIPERWLLDGEDKYREDKRGVTQPFLVGPRNCIGQSHAWAQMKLILAKMVWNFDIELTRNNVEDWTEQKIYTLPETLPLNIRLKKKEIL